MAQTPNDDRSSIRYAGRILAKGHDARNEFRRIQRV